MRWKTQELTDVTLDAAVAKACRVPYFESLLWKPSSDWGHAGQVLDLGLCAIAPDLEREGSWAAQWGVGERRFQALGTTALEAAMRAMVGSSFGEEIELP